MAPGVFNMRPTTQVHELAGLVHADAFDAATDQVLVFQIRDRCGASTPQVVQKFDLEVLSHASKTLDRVADRHFGSLERQLLRYLAAHDFLDFLEVLRRQGPVQADVVVEAVFDNGADSKPGFRVEFLDAGGHEVGQ